MKNLHSVGLFGHRRIASWPGGPVHRGLPRLQFQWLSDWTYWRLDLFGLIFVHKAHA